MNESKLITMRNNFAIGISLLALSLAVRVLAAQSAGLDPDKTRIIALENAWNQAEWQKDQAALSMLLAPDLIYVEYDGTLMNRTEYLASMLSASLHPSRITNDSISVHVYVGFAVANGVYRENGVKNGKPYSVHTRFTDTWIRRNQIWVCVASQSTRLNEP
jgi:ketosteroid isomerase-like protein